MQDPRALSSLRQLASYRAWEQEGFRRSGFLIFTTVLPASTAVLIAVFLAFRHALPRGAVVWLGGALVGYLLVITGLMVVAVLRLDAWKKAHPWAPDLA